MESAQQKGGTYVRGPFMKDFSIIIQIQWKFHSAPIQIAPEWLLWNFAHEWQLCWYAAVELH